jgi:hypothetical protein
MPSNKADDLVVAIKKSEKPKRKCGIQVTSVDPTGHRWQELRSEWSSLPVARQKKGKETFFGG